MGFCLLGTVFVATFEWAQNWHNILKNCEFKLKSQYFEYVLESLTLRKHLRASFEAFFVLKKTEKMLHRLFCTSGIEYLYPTLP